MARGRERGEKRKKWRKERGMVGKDDSILGGTTRRVLTILLFVYFRDTSRFRPTHYIPD